MDIIRFFDGEELIGCFSYDNIIVPHLGSDIVVNDKRYFVIDVLITYEEGMGQHVDVVTERINELD